MVELSSLPPPAYTPTDAQDGAGSSLAHQRCAIPAGIKPTNFLIVSRPGKLKGIWVINPSMEIYEALLPPQKESRKNILLESEAGGIDVDIFVMPSSRNPSECKTTIEIRTGKESLYIRVVSLHVECRFPCGRLNRRKS